jgi:predicted XRE-type DNA-binding protein
LREFELLYGVMKMARRARQSGTDNVLVDLALPDAQKLTAKAVLAKRINDVIERRRLTQSMAGRLLGLPQPMISALRNYKLRGFSRERLMQAVISLHL